MEDFNIFPRLLHIHAYKGDHKSVITAQTVIFYVRN